MNEALKGDILVPAYLANRVDVYRCPDCGDPVHYKYGKKIRAHFAHYPESTCSYAGAGSLMTEDHMHVQKGIHQALLGHPDVVRVWLEHQTVNDEGGWRQADIFAELASHKVYVFEVQHSPISKETAVARRTHYLERGYELVWVLTIADLAIDSSSIDYGRPLDGWQELLAELNAGIVYLYQMSELIAFYHMPADFRGKRGFFEYGERSRFFEPRHPVLIQPSARRDFVENWVEEIRGEMQKEREAEEERKIEESRHRYRQDLAQHHEQLANYPKELEQYERELAMYKERQAEYASLLAANSARMDVYKRECEKWDAWYKAAGNELDAPYRRLRESLLMVVWDWYPDRHEPEEIRNSYRRASEQLRDAEAKTQLGGSAIFVGPGVAVRRADRDHEARLDLLERELRAIGDLTGQWIPRPDKPEQSERFVELRNWIRLQPLMVEPVKPSRPQIPDMLSGLIDEDGELLE